MSEEEKNAIEILKNMDINWRGLTSCNKCSYVDDEHKCFDDINGDCQMVAIKTILNLIKKQQEQLQEKDKIIYEMAIYIAGLDIDEDICKKTDKSNCDEMALGECEECIIEYFTKKVGEV